MDVIEIAKECGIKVFGVPEDPEDHYMIVCAKDLQQFAQRIEQPLQQRIAELEQELHYAKQAARAEADMYDKARQASRFTSDVADQALADLKDAKQKIEQLREALQDIKSARERGFSIFYVEGYASKALEETK